MARPLMTADLGADGIAWRPRLVIGLLLAHFALLGLTIGAQGVLWAELLPLLGVGAGLFGSAQLVSPLVSVALLLLGGQLSAWAGKKRLALASLLLLGSAALVLAGSVNLAGLLAALVLLGAGNGLFETAMNGAAIDWEAATGRRVLNPLHAGFSAGAVAGALGTGTLLGAGWAPGAVLLLLAAASWLLLAVTLPVGYPPAGAAGAPAGDLGATLRPLLTQRGLGLLAVICMLGAVGESVANLWSVIYLYAQGAGALLGGATFALLNAAILVGRLVNAPLVARLGARASLGVSGSGLALAALLLVLPGGLPMAVAAFVLLGLAVAGVVPTVLSEAARLAPGNSGAVAGGILAALYLSFMLCPPLIGWLAELVSLQAALLSVGLSGLAILGLARLAGSRSATM